MIKVSTTGMMVSSKMDLRFPITGQWGHGARIIHLGDSRINGLKTMIGNEVKKGNGFRDLNTYAQGCNGYLSAENRIKYLEMQLAYKDQEIEFLKKIVSLNPETPE